MRDVAEPMTETPHSLTETTFPTSRVPGPSGTDVLSDVLRVFRVTGAALLRGEFTAPWAWETPPARAIASLLHTATTRVVIFHIVAEGECWVEVDGEPREQLEAGDMVGFPLGHAHRMGNGTIRKPLQITTLFPPLPWTELPVLHCGGDGAVTRIVCVYLRCDDLPFNPFLSALPAMLIVRRQEEVAQWIEETMRYIVREATSGGPGGAGLIARLTELMFIEILRHHIQAPQAGGKGWLAALGDRHLARALYAMHAQPKYPWTVEDLASHAGVSRSALVGRFHRILAMTPMNYLALWRLQLAQQVLRDTDLGIANVAEEVGYRSEAAFSRAFKRHMGVAPSVWRQESQ